MKLALEKKHENRIEFIVEGINTSFANAIRRYSMMRVPVLAISSVTFYDNTSSYWDEYLAHRLGMMPILTPSRLAKSAEVMFVIDEQGPKKVYSKDLKSSDSKIKVAKDNIIVATLGENMRLRLEAKATVADGTVHARHQAGLVSYGIEGGKHKFFVESYYTMPPADVILKGCDELTSDIDKLEKFLSGKKPKKEAKKKAEKKPAKKKKPKAKKSKK